MQATSVREQYKLYDPVCRTLGKRSGSDGHIVHSGHLVGPSR